MEIILEITGVNKITPPSERFLSVIIIFYHRSGRKARFPNEIKLKSSEESKAGGGRKQHSDFAQIKNNQIV